MKDYSSKFRIRYTIDLVMDEFEIWPDGNFPPEPTIQDVFNEIKKYSRTSTNYSKEPDSIELRDEDAKKIIDDWNLVDFGVLEITKEET